MFSGITNQFSNLLGKAGEGGEQAGDAAAAAGHTVDLAAAEPQPATVDAAVEGAEAGAEG